MGSINACRLHCRTSYCQRARFAPARSHLIRINQLTCGAKDTANDRQHQRRHIMRLHHMDMDPAAACASLRHGRKILRAQVAALRAEPDAGFAQKFARLVAAVEAGFRHEEGLLELLGDACLHPRRADHAVILCALHRTMSQVEGGDVKLGRQVVDALDAVLSLPSRAVSDAPMRARTTYRPLPGTHLHHLRLPSSCRPGKHLENPAIGRRSRI